MSFVAANNAPLDIYVNGNAVIPVGLYLMKGAGLIADPIIGSFTITMIDGAQLENLGFIAGQLTLQANATNLTPLVFTAAAGESPNALLLRFNGILQNNGAIPMIEVAAGDLFVLGIILNGTLLVPGAAPIFNIGAGAVVIIGATGDTIIDNGWLTGSVGSTLLYQNGGGIPSPLPLNAGFAGSTLQNILLGTSCTDPTTRPVNPFGSLAIGATIFDQSLGTTGKPIWWDGTQWVDAAGAPA